MLIVGAGHSGTLAAIAAAEAGAAEVLVADLDPKRLRAVAALGIGAVRTVAADATDALAFAAAVGEPAQLCVSCVDRPGAEPGCILATAPGGHVLFFSMATDFAHAALGAEGVGSAATLELGNGLYPGHAELALDLLRRYPALWGMLTPYESDRALSGPDRGNDVSQDAEPDTGELALAAGRALRAAGWRAVTAESCTGGGVASALTDVPGSSEWFERGYVTYSNEAKMEDLGVEPAVLRTHGAVSVAVAEQMVAGALRASGADVAVAITGIAGPDGGTLEKPIGLVYLAVGRRGGSVRVQARAVRGRSRGGAERRGIAAALRLLAQAPPQRVRFSGRVGADIQPAPAAPIWDNCPHTNRGPCKHGR